MKRYQLEGGSLEIGAPVEVGCATGHHWFATLHCLGEQEVLCEVVLADDKAQGKWPARAAMS